MKAKLPPCVGDSDSRRHMKAVGSVVGVVGVDDGVETCCPSQTVSGRISHVVAVAICRKLGSYCSRTGVIIVVSIPRSMRAIPEPFP